MLTSSVFITRQRMFANVDVAHVGFSCTPKYHTHTHTRLAEPYAKITHCSSSTERIILIFDTSSNGILILNNDLMHLALIVAELREEREVDLRSECVCVCDVIVVSLQALRKEML